MDGQTDERTIRKHDARRPLLLAVLAQARKSEVGLIAMYYLRGGQQSGVGIQGEVGQLVVVV